jgi:hypothetical protein
VRKNTLNFIIDCIAAVTMLTMISTGLLLYFILPPGSRGGHGLLFWGLDRHEWGDIHFWSAVALIVLMVLHVLLHWKWVCLTVYSWVNPEGFPQKKLTPRRRNLYGLGFFVLVVLLVGGFLTLATAGVTRGDQGRGRGRGATLGLRTPDDLHAPAFEAGEHGQGGQGRGGGQIRGSTTLREAAELAGIDVEQLKQELGLPADVPPDERLGRLRQEYGFEMSDVRRIVAEHAGASDENP